MNTTCSLTNKKCVPCEGGIPPLNHDETTRLLNELKGGWTLNPEGHLYKKISFPNFIKAMDYANEIAHLAEQEGHHPDLTVAFGSLQIEIWTHKINGLTESDFILAAKIDALT